MELPKPGAGLASGQSFGVIESVKTASDLIAPVSGEVVEVNALLREEPWQVNDSPEGAGWILKARLSGPDPSASLMDERAYRKLTEG